MAKKGMSPVDWIAIVLLAIGGINWGLVGALSFNLVEYLTFGVSILARIIYVVVGLAGLYTGWFIFKQLTK